MTNVDRINLTDVLDEHFCLLAFDPASRRDRTPEDRVYNNKKFRTLDLSSSYDVSGLKRRIQNLLEIKNNGVLRELRFRFTDDHVKRVAVSRVEDHLGNLRFGWADIYDGALFFVVDTLKAGLTPFRLSRWLENNIEHAALTLEGKRYVRISFSHENDFVLTKLKFS